MTEEEMIGEMQRIMSGQVPEDEIESLLVTLADRGETVEEITGAAKVMREKAHKIKAPANAVDCCGTGGDQSGTYNISTAVAIVAASCGVPIAKHGNRAASSKSGAADVLEALGINLDASQEILEQALERYNFAFLMAPRHHEAMKYVVPVRKRLGRRTIFNLLGPLANPAGTQYQLVGVFDEKWVRPIAETLNKLGTKRAWVVHGSDGLDEITTTGPTRIAILDNGQIEEKNLSPNDFGLDESLESDLKGGDAQHNARALMGVLEGHKSAYRDIVLANTAAVLIIHSGKTDLKAAVDIAARSIDDGLALRTLENYRDFVGKAA